MSGRSPRIISVKLPTRIGSLTVGGTIKLNESGSPVEFYISAQNYEPELNGAGRTLLVRKDTCQDRMHFSETDNAYAGATLDAWFNETFLLRLDADIQAKIPTTKFFYTPGNGDKTVATLERKIFALSGTEYGGSASNTMNSEGTELPIAAAIEKAYLNGSAVNHWTRTPNIYNEVRAYYIDTTGALKGNYNAYSYNYYARPAFTLPSDFVVTDEMLA